MRNLKNLTITVEPEVAKWARVWAAKQESSISMLVGRLLREMMDNELEYEKARKSYFERSIGNISGGKPYPKRDELYE